MSKAIEVNNISKALGSNVILDQLNFQMSPGDKLSIVGPSGSGKTTLLRILAGLDQPSSGTIKIGEKDVTHLDARTRKVGLVFQQPLLFPHMTVEENINYGAKLTGRFSKGKTRDLLAAINLTETRTRFPSELSGGQQQRVALARALATEPEILLLDEPFSSLDPTLRQELRYWVRDLLNERGITSIFVTHDREEAMLMGDTIGVFYNGRFQQLASTETILQSPANPFVVQFFDNHLLLDQDHYVPLNKISFRSPATSARVMKAALLQTSVTNGERVAHVYLKELNKRLSLRLPFPHDGSILNIFIPNDHIYSFDSSSGVSDYE
ncbi:ABC transporter ATP-binding protein [Halobacillus sp. B23F22_1]|uniref:ABC transporter ATP-binding protein n=1 Tax=Halobacillus sp. B23F22_1 TaxID=3459514 RepID=UPI00373E77E0